MVRARKVGRDGCLVLILMACLPHSSSAQVFSTSDNTLVYFLQGTSSGSCTPASPAFASSGKWFASSASVQNRCCVQNCAGRVSGQMTYLALVDENTGAPTAPSPTAVPATFCMTATTTIALPRIRARVTTGSFCDGSAFASATIGDQSVSASSNSGCGNQEQVSNPLTGAIAGGESGAIFAFELFGSHSNSSSKVGYAQVDAGATTITTDCSFVALPGGFPGPGTLLASRQSNWDAAYSLASFPMNPGPDSRNVPVWGYGYLTPPAAAQAPASATTADWLSGSITPLAWFPNWAGTGLAAWGVTNSAGAVITRDGPYTYLAPPFSNNVPVVTWRYRYDSPALIELANAITVRWSSAGSTVAANLIVARRAAADGHIEVGMDTVVTPNGNLTQAIALGGLRFSCSRNDEIILALRGTTTGGASEWLQLQDGGLQWQFVGALSVPDLSSATQARLVLRRTQDADRVEATLSGVSDGRYDLRLFDVAGKTVHGARREVIVSGGSANLVWDLARDGRHIPPGVYFARVCGSSGQAVASGRVVVVR